MTVRKGKFPRSTIRVLMKEAGAKIVSKESIEYMDTLIKDFVRETTGKALILMKHGKRKTLMVRDLELIQIRGR